MTGEGGDRRASLHRLTSQISVGFVFAEPPSIHDDHFGTLYVPNCFDILVKARDAAAQPANTIEIGCGQALNSFEPRQAETADGAPHPGSNPVAFSGVGSFFRQQEDQCGGRLARDPGQSIGQPRIKVGQDDIMFSRETLSHRKQVNYMTDAAPEFPQ